MQAAVEAAAETERVGRKKGRRMAWKAKAALDKAASGAAGVARWQAGALRRVRLLLQFFRWESGGGNDGSCRFEA